jgi:hypothetical protein
MAFFREAKKVLYEEQVLTKTTILYLGDTTWHMRKNAEQQRDILVRKKVKEFKFRLAEPERPIWEVERAERATTGKLGG